MAKMLFISDNLLNEGLGIMYLSAYLKANGHSVDLTLLQDHRTLDEVISYVEAYNPDLVGFSVMTPQADTFIPISKLIKERTDKTVIWGGPHSMFMSAEIERYGCVDIICTGDGEDALLALMNRIEADEDYSDIPSLTIKVDDTWVKNPLGHLDDDLDKYPFPDRSLYYDKYPMLANFAIKRLITSRGCPYKCSYCFEPTYFKMYKGKGKVVRRHSVDYVLEEIKQVTEKYPTRHIHFSDDIFNLNKRWVSEFTSRYKTSSSKPLEWTCNVELTSIDEQIIQLMGESGCRGVVFGLESGVEETRINVLNKKITDQRYTSMAEVFHTYDIKFIMNLMFCLPGESLADAIKSIRFASSLKPYGVRPCILKVYKGTELAKYATVHGYTEGVGHLTIKTKDTHNDFSKIANMEWAATLFVRFPFLIRFAEKILTSKLANLGKYIIFLNHWEDVKFFQVPLWQAFKYFLASSKQFTEGMAKAQDDTYTAEKEAPAGGMVIQQKNGCPSNFNPIGIRDWHGQDPVEVYQPVIVDDEDELFSTVSAEIRETLNEFVAGHPDATIRDGITFSNISFMDGDAEFHIHHSPEMAADLESFKASALKTIEEMPGIVAASCRVVEQPEAAQAT